MSAERVHRDQLRQMSPEQFLAAYLAVQENQWEKMSRGMLRAWNDELVFKGLVTRVEDAIGELKTPSARWLDVRVSQEAFPDQWAALEKREAESSSSPTTDASERLMDSQLSSIPVALGEPSTAPDAALPAGWASKNGQPSIGASSGARNDAESGYEIVAYRRLPLAGKRDAFIAEGMLYVRNSVLKKWFEHLCLGKCCPAQQDGAKHHSMGCWLDAVR